MQHWLSPTFWQYVEQYYNCNPEQAALNKTLQSSGYAQAVAQQLRGRQLLVDKCPFTLDINHWVYPPRINCEQCSSEATAKFKASLIPQGSVVADLTGGLGIDSYIMSGNCRTLYYVEQNKELFDIASWNFRQTGCTNIISSQMEAASWLDSTDNDSNSNKIDLFYLDPARRDLNNNKVYNFGECHPNIIELLPTLNQRQAEIMVKASPMINIEEGIKSVRNCHDVYIIAIHNECKEVLFSIGATECVDPATHCVDLSRTGEIYSHVSFQLSETAEKVQQTCTALGKYLYEPNASIMKAGAWNVLHKTYGIDKLAERTHLFSSDKKLVNFPGRVYEIISVCNPSTKDVGKHITNGMGNVIVKNFPEQASTMQKRLGLKTGSDLCVVATTFKQKKIAIICKLLPYCHPFD